MVLKSSSSQNKNSNYGSVSLRRLPYWKLVGKKVFLGFFLILTVKIYFIFKYNWLMAMDRSGGYDWILGIVIYMSLGLVLSKKPNLSFKKIAAIGGWSGLYLGFLSAFLDLLFFHNLWTLFNMFRKPILFAAIGFAVTTIVYILVSDDYSSYNKKLSKD